MRWLLAGRIPIVPASGPDIRPERRRPARHRGDDLGTDGIPVHPSGGLARIRTREGVRNLDSHPDRRFLWGKETRSALSPRCSSAGRPVIRLAPMLWSLRYRLLCRLLRLLQRCGVDELDLETAVLRHQLKILRRGGTCPRFTTADRAFLAAAARVLTRDRWRSFLVRPDTLARWHQDLLRRRRRGRSRRPGRPPLDLSIKSLILRLGRENPRWGYLRNRGELLKLGIDVSATTIATVLRQGGLGPAPRRIGPTWTQFLRAQAYGLLSSESRSDEQGNRDDLARARQREAPAPAGDDWATTEGVEPLHDPPRRNGVPMSTVVTRPAGSVTPAPQGPRGRDGPALAA